MVDKNQLLQVTNIIFSYVLELKESDVLALIEGSKVIKLIEKSDNVKLEQVELESKETELTETKRANKKSGKKIAAKKVNKKQEEEVKVVEIEEIKQLDNSEEVTEEDIINDTINKVMKFKTKKEAITYLNEKRFTVKLLTTIAKKCNIYVKSRSKREVIIEKIIEGI